ncbi:YaaC family protein [Stieleria varia]|nr:YaaC family protein [Stieleria varia]
MSRSPQPGKQATYNHAKVVYSPFEAAPGAQFLLTADPWSFLTAWINQKLAAGPRGPNRTRLERALYYANLAESFYAASRRSSLPAQGTLAYYGILNLVKCFLSIRGVDLETKMEHHGLSLPLGSKQQVQIAAPGGNALNIFHEFSRLLGKPVSGRETVTIKEIAGHLPEIHEMAFTLGHVTGNKRGFLPIDIQFLLTESDSHLFTEVVYEKKQISRVDINRFHRGERKSYFSEGVDRDGCVVHRSAKRKKCNWDSFPRIYRNACAEYAKFDVCSLLTPKGYVYYCDLRSPKLHHLSYSLLMMFYIGTAARYRPSEMRELLETDVRPLISEALAVIPGQMLYHLVSYCTSSNCVVPHATIAR